jgi:plastocyanin
MILRALVLLLTLAVFAPAYANTVRVRVVDGHGAPVANAVVTLHGAAPPAGPIRFVWPMRIAQRDMQFEPFVLIAPAGASVSFPNLDDVRHQVYSFSQPGPFELRLYGHDESRSVQFRNVGVIAIGCNIHDQMSAYIYVVDTPYAMRTGADGVAILDAPAGAARLRLWHPYLRAPGNTLERAMAVGAGANEQSFQIRLRAPPVHGQAY